jgi:DNA processing protein
MSGHDPGYTVDENEWLRDDDHHVVRLGHDAYPELLAGITGPASQLFVIGDPEILHLPALAIVGSRNPTKGGAQNAFEFARHLGETGFCIVSGLAQGIDAAAHRGALAAGAPTVAILGHGIDRVYPASNRELARDIARHGALVSEFPLGTAPNRALFPQRNRLISGLSLGTLVVEAARRSGSLITARLAAEQGREVFAIPGSIHNPLSRGCHQLIRQGAKLVEAADDIVAELAPLAGHLLQAIDASAAPGRALAGPAEPDGEYVKLLEAIGHDPVRTDELVERSGLTIEEVSSMLLILELEGKIEKLSGGRYSVLS